MSSIVSTKVDRITTKRWIHCTETTMRARHQSKSEAGDVMTPPRQSLAEATAAAVDEKHTTQGSPLVDLIGSSTEHLLKLVGYFVEYNPVFLVISTKH